MKLQKEKVILTGFRATGKSSVGNIPAKSLDLDFADTDKAAAKFPAALSGRSICTAVLLADKRRQFLMPTKK